jgi:hypothetical protein
VYDGSPRCPEFSNNKNKWLVGNVLDNYPELHQFIRADGLIDCGGVVIRANAETPEGIEVPCAEPEALRVYRRVPC